jgi:hypothetical protein
MSGGAAWMGYEWDVFLSYRRSNDWPMFVEKHFYPKLQQWLDAWVGDDTKIFVDSRVIETGDSWPHQLAHGLAHSKVMLCLWSRQYFTSRWCALELSQMLARRRSLTGRSGPPPLVLAALIHDSETVDPDLRDIQRFPMQKYSNPWISDGSPTAERLAEEINTLAAHVADALHQAPEWDDSWPDLVTKEFARLFDSEVRQVLPPSLG